MWTLTVKFSGDKDDLEITAEGEPAVTFVDHSIRIVCSSEHKIYVPCEGLQYVELEYEDV